MKKFMSDWLVHRDAPKPVKRAFGLVGGIEAGQKAVETKSDRWFNGTHPTQSKGAFSLVGGSEGLTQLKNTSDWYVDAGNPVEKGIWPQR